MGWLQDQINRQQKEDLKKFRAEQKQREKAEAHQKKIRAAKEVIKRRNELRKIKQAHAPRKGYSIFGIKKKRQNKTLSRKSRIRII